MGIEIIILDYNSKNYFISKYNTEHMLHFEKEKLIERWERRISRELNIPYDKFHIRFIAQSEVGCYRLRPYTTIKYSEKRFEKTSDKDKIPKLKITLDRDFINKIDN